MMGLSLQHKPKTMEVGQQRDDDWTRLLERVGKHKDESAFAKLFQHFAPLVKGFCRSHASIYLSLESSEELMQEVMCKVWLKATMFDGCKASASTWIFSIARNARIDYLRKHRKPHAQLESLEADDIWEEGSEEQAFIYIEQTRAATDVRQHLKMLPKEQAHCLKKVYMEGKSHSEIATELELPLGTVKSRVRLGLKRLQASVER